VTEREARHLPEHHLGTVILVVEELVQQRGARGDQVVARARVLELAAHAREAAIGVRAQDLREEALLGAEVPGDRPAADARPRSDPVESRPRDSALACGGDEPVNCGRGDAPLALLRRASVLMGHEEPRC
jgi:hypothetical protein